MKLSSMTFGGTPFSDVFNIILEALSQRGINSFDMAPQYSIKRAWRQSSRVINGQRDHVLLVSKCWRDYVQISDLSASPREVV